MAGFRKELAYNEDQVKYVLTRLPSCSGKIARAISTLSAAPIPAEAERIDYPGFSLDIVSTASWDTAIATQALNELPFDAVTRYAQGYGALRLFVETERERLTRLAGRASIRHRSHRADSRSTHVAGSRARHYGNVLTVIDFAGTRAPEPRDDALTAPR